MTVDQLRAALAHIPGDDLVMAMGNDLTPLSIRSVRVESEGDDGEGHATSVGGTVWLEVEES